MSAHPLRPTKPRTVSSLTPPPLHLTNAPPGPEAYACLQADFAQRKRRFLRMLASQTFAWPEFETQVPAMLRKYL
ncbi:MAG: hypothetical protein ABI877_17500, partial [Gemmatimonadaceae bacterium]